MEEELKSRVFPYVFNCYRLKEGREKDNMHRLRKKDKGSDSTDCLSTLLFACSSLVALLPLNPYAVVGEMLTHPRTTNCFQVNIVELPLFRGKVYKVFCFICLFCFVERVIHMIHMEKHKTSGFHKYHYVYIKMLIVSQLSNYTHAHE